MSDEDDLEWIRKGFEENIIYVDEETWDWLNALLDEPPEPNPKLQEAFRRADEFRYGGSSQRTKADLARQDEEEGP